MSHRPVGIRPAGPRRNQVTPPKGRTEQVEVSKIDPAQVLAPPNRGLTSRGLTSAEQSLLDNAIPITTPAWTDPEPKGSETKQDVPAPPVEAKAPPVAAKADDDRSITDDISDSLIDRLSERFGLKGQALQDMVLEAGGRTVNVTLRRQVYEDYIWTVGVFEEMLRSGSDSSLVAAETQRAQYIGHLSACRSVIKIEGEFVWEVFHYTDLIKTAVPNWDGVNSTVIPGDLASGIAKAVHALFKQLHPDLLFDLSSAVRIAWKETASEEPPEQENPTPAT